MIGKESKLTKVSATALDLGILYLSGKSQGILKSAGCRNHGEVLFLRGMSNLVVWQGFEESKK